MKNIVVRNEDKEKTAVFIPAGGLDETAFNPIMPYLEEYRVINFLLFIAQCTINKEDFIWHGLSILKADIA